MQVRRLHPVALLYFWYQSFKSGLLYLFISFAFNFSDKLDGYFGGAVTIILLLTVLGGILKYLRYTYELTPQEIILNSGIIFQKHLYISYAKIQTLQTKQWFYLRPFGLLSLQVETSSQSEDAPEAILPVASRKVVAQIQEKRDAFQTKEQQTETFSKTNNNLAEKVSEGYESSYQIKGRDQNLYALTSLGFFPLVLGFLAIYNRLSNAIPQKYLDSAMETLVHESGLILSLLALVIVLLALGVSYLLVLNRYFGFEVHQEKEQLVTTKGLLQQNVVTARPEKIQAVVISQSFLRQALKLATVQLVLASQAANDEQDEDLVLLPVLSQGQALKKASRFVKWLPQKTPNLQMVGRIGRWRLLRNMLLPTILLVVSVGVFFRPYGWLATILLPFALWVGHYAGANSGLAVTNSDILLAQSGHLLTRKMYLIPHNKIQALSMKQTVWMKKAGLSHLEIILRSGNSQHEEEIRYLPQEQVEKIYQWYRQK